MENCQSLKLTVIKIKLQENSICDNVIFIPKMNVGFY